MANLWKDNLPNTSAKVKILDYVFYTEYFDDFPNEGLVADEQRKQFFKILQDKAIEVVKTTRDVNVLMGFFMIQWMGLTQKKDATPREIMWALMLACKKHLTENKDDVGEIDKYFEVFFWAFVTKERLEKINKIYKEKNIDNFIKESFYN